MKYTTSLFEFSVFLSVLKAKANTDEKDFLDNWEPPDIGVVFPNETTFLRNVKRSFNHVINQTIPKTFDLRDHPHCGKTIKKIRHQGHCSNCWAVATGTSLRDRYCIHHPEHPEIEFSAEDFVYCCTGCINTKEDNYDKVNPCKKGGAPANVLYFLYNEGVVTGGYYNSKEGCKPYSAAPFKNAEYKPCELYCTNPDFDPTRSYTEDKIFAKETFYVLKPKLEQIQMELMLNGPVVLSFKATPDFQKSYKSGVYKVPPVSGEKGTYHAVRLVGWGEESGTEYWLIANSWGEKFGEKGFFKLPRGVNYQDIEKSASASMPQLHYKQYVEVPTTAKPSAAARNKLHGCTVFLTILLCKSHF